MQAAELEYEAALERRRREVEAERQRREIAAAEAAGARACAAEASPPPGNLPKHALHLAFANQAGPCRAYISLSKHFHTARVILLCWTEPEILRARGRRFTPEMHL